MKPPQGKVICILLQTNALPSSHCPLGHTFSATVRFSYLNPSRSNYFLVIQKADFKYFFPLVLTSCCSGSTPTLTSCLRLFLILSLSVVNFPVGQERLGRQTWCLVEWRWYLMEAAQRMNERVCSHNRIALHVYYLFVTFVAIVFDIAIDLFPLMSLSWWSIVYLSYSKFRYFWNPNMICFIANIHSNPVPQLLVQII